MLSKRPRRAWIVFVLSVSAALHGTSPAHAWGRLGHRVISRLAETNLTLKAKAAIAEILEPGESLADASLWNSDRWTRTAKSQTRWKSHFQSERPMDTHCEIADQMEMSFIVSYDERNTMIVAADRLHNACLRVASRNWCGAAPDPACG